MPSGSPDTIPCFDPATLEPLGEVQVTSAEEVVTLVQRARAAQPSWGQTALAERRKVLGQLLERILDRADELCTLIARDSGKTRENAMLGEVWPVCAKLRWTIAHGEQHLRPERVSAGPFWHKQATIEFAPLGVVGVICPWNYPLQNILGPLVSALMAGNACVVKPSEWVAYSSARIHALLEEVLAQAGHPGLVQIVYGYADTGRALIRSGVDKVVFTGSVANGRQVISESAEQIVPLILELGGKDALIVCDDADLEQAAHATMAGVFVNCGQNCLAAERILVFAGIQARFEQRVVELTRKLRQGPPLGGQPVDLGAMVSPLQLDLVDRMVARAIEQGARLVHQGEPPLAHGGQFYPPTILADVTQDMEIMQQELFGPVVLLCRVADEEEAIAVANGTSFGLGCTILTKDRRRAQRLARRIVAGGVSINNFGLTYMVQDLPFGGTKASGFGRLNGRDGLRAFTNVKAVLSDRWPLRRPAKLYPVGREDYDLIEGAIEVLYHPRPAAKLRGASRVLKALRRHLAGSR